MSDPLTFEEMARELARAGAARACAAEAEALDGRSGREPGPRAVAIREAARGLRLASRLLSQLASCADAPPPFRPVGLRGAVAAGHAALAAGRPGQAERVGAGVAEAAPWSGAGLRLVAQALFAQGRFGLAVRALRGAIAADPHDPFTRALHAEALWFAGERLAARAVISMARATWPHEPLARALDRALRAGALERAGRTRCA